MTHTGPPPGSRARRALLIVGGLSVPLLLAVFWWLSRDAVQVQQTGYFAEPPIYGLLEPTWSARSLIGVGAALAFVVVSVIIVRANVGPRLFGAALVVSTVGTSIAINQTRGLPHVLRPICQGPYPDCFDTAVDLHLLQERGVRDFVVEFPELHRSFLSVHTRTHPPGGLVVLDGLDQMFGSGFWTATALAVAAALTTVCCYVMARLFADESSARKAALLLASSPALLLFSYASMDALYASALTISGTVFVAALRAGARFDPRLVIGGGFLLGLTTFLTFAAAFIALAVTGASLIVLDGWRTRLRFLGLAAVGGCSALLVLRVTLGFDVFAVYQAYEKSQGGRPWAYWLIGTPAVYLIFAGVVLAPLGLIGALRGRFAFGSVLLGSLLVFAALPQQVTGIGPGEIERTWLFTMPFFAVGAATVIGRHWLRPQSTFGQTLATAMALSAQLGLAIALEARYDVFW